MSDNRSAVNASGQDEIHRRELQLIVIQRSNNQKRRMPPATVRFDRSSHLMLVPTSPRLRPQQVHTARPDPLIEPCPRHQPHRRRGYPLELSYGVAVGLGCRDALGLGIPWGSASAGRGRDSPLPAPSFCNAMPSPPCLRLSPLLWSGNATVSRPEAHRRTGRQPGRLRTPATAAGAAHLEQSLVHRHVGAVVGGQSRESVGSFAAALGAPAINDQDEAGQIPKRTGQDRVVLAPD